MSSSTGTSKGVILRVVLLLLMYLDLGVPAGEWEVELLLLVRTARYTWNCVVLYTFPPVFATILKGFANNLMIVLRVDTTLHQTNDCCKLMYVVFRAKLCK